MIGIEPERRTLLACMPPVDSVYSRGAKLLDFVSRWYEISAGEGAVDTEDAVALQELRRLLNGGA